jgi:uncharacterized protein involved in tolerance to divalent cations
MIFLRILSKSEVKIEEIAKLLLYEKLVIDVNIKRHVERAELVNGKLIFTRIVLLTAKTKAVLFDSIDQRLNEKYPNHMPEVYAMPIMQMDWKQANELKKEVASKPSFGKLRQALNKMKGRD